jgi:uncharacterized protein
MVKPYLTIKTSENRGRGVYTTRSIKKDVVIEIAPVIVLTEKDRVLIDQTTLYNYIFEWEPNGEKLCCMALGTVPLYNHSYASNCEYFMDYENGQIQVQTIRDVVAGEELTVNYNGDWNNEARVWFDAV